jgi:hypothetical protein
MHARLNAQHRVLRRTRLDCRLQRRARVTVDRALIAAAVSQPLLQRLDLGGVYVGQIARLRRERREDNRNAKHEKLPESAHDPSLREVHPDAARMSGSTLQRKVEWLNNPAYCRTSRLAHQVISLRCSECRLSRASRPKL